MTVLSPRFRDKHMKAFCFLTVLHSPTVTADMTATHFVFQPLLIPALALHVSGITFTQQTVVSLPRVQQLDIQPVDWHHVYPADWCLCPAYSS
ncbi:hypothetical protein BgiBS90_010463 [Biomphalaria glabrata]|nr:hypothetical protein BgiBS90_010463 [Biomphalaria glabrata]